MIFVLTGNGKGKTTSALGMGIRAAGAGQKVLMVQFLKTSASSENKIIKRIENFDIKTFGRRGFAPFGAKDALLARKGLRFLEKEAEKYKMIIMDEINVALKFNLISGKEVLSFLDAQDNNKHIILTGRSASKDICDKADLITEFKEVKHYFRRGVKAVKGIEY
ncbi:MAG: cob(I)yrinic acid a,c-diamide adenosyltransferase [Candidatus Nealsonbacteria bacterium]|nr:cob(I)yrinic acid a,c-diamide adenosyltransferase [Candidatus Nealsonbacteria bacterium]